MPTMASADLRLMGVREAAAEYGVSEQTLRYWLDKGELRKHKTGRGRVFVDVDELERLLQFKRTPRVVDGGEGGAE